MAHDYRFGVYELNTERGELLSLESGKGVPIHIPPQPLLALQLLVLNAGVLTSREALGHAIWRDGVFVDQELGLNHCIKRLRAVLGDDASNPSYIQTVPRRGYRFIAPVEKVASSEGESGERWEVGALVPPHPSMPTDVSSARGSANGSQPLLLAILSFATYSPRLTESFFGDGLAEEVLREAFCEAPPGLRILALQSPSRYEMAVEMRAQPDYFMSGSARWERGRLRVIGYLVQARTQAVLQTHVWELCRDDLGLETQQLAAREIVHALLQSEGLAGEAQGRIREAPRIDWPRDLRAHSPAKLRSPAVLEEPASEELISSKVS